MSVVNTSNSGSSEVIRIVETHIELLQSQGKEDLASIYRALLQGYEKSFEENDFDVTKFFKFDT